MYRVVFLLGLSLLPTPNGFGFSTKSDADADGPISRGGPPPAPAPRPGDVLDIGPGKCLRQDVIDCPSKHCFLDPDAEPDSQSDGQPCGMAYRHPRSKFLGGKPKFERVAYRLDGACSYCQTWWYPPQVKEDFPYYYDPWLGSEEIRYAKCTDIEVIDAEIGHPPAGDWCIDRRYPCGFGCRSGGGIVDSCLLGGGTKDPTGAPTGECYDCYQPCNAPGQGEGSGCKRDPFLVTWNSVDDDDYFCMKLEGSGGELVCARCKENALDI